MNMKLLRGLIDAGLTNEQIEQVLEAIGDVKQPEPPTQQPEQQPEPPTQQPEQQLKQPGAIQKNDSDDATSLKDLFDNSFNDFIRKFQSINILNSQQPHQETADDILASIINPPNMKE